MSQLIEKICEVCEKSFRVVPSRIETARFCSINCYKRYKKQHPDEFPKPPRRGYSVEVRCKYCNKTFKKIVSLFLKRKKHFCSMRCYIDYRHEHPEEYSGENHWNWKGGVSEIYHQERKSEEYQRWRDIVFRRDNWTCQKCGYKGHEIVAHHIKNFGEYPELRYDVNNGITLCRACHKKLHYNIGEETQFKKGQYPWNKLPIPSKEQLEELYWKQKLSSIKMSKIFKTCRQTVIRWLKHYDIPIRTFSEARKNYFQNQHKSITIPIFSK